jgi:hypothetical protein
MNYSQPEFGAEAVLMASEQGGKSPRLKNLLQHSSKMIQTGKPEFGHIILKFAC